MILAAIAVTAVASAAPVHAEQWWVVGADRDHAEVVELDTVTTSSIGTRRMWTAFIYAAPLKGTPEPNVYVSRSLFELDCQDGRYRILQSAFLTKELSNLDTRTHPEVNWTYAPPGTRGYVFLNAACRGIDKSDAGGPWPNLGEAVQRYFRYLSDEAASK